MRFISPTLSATGWKKQTIVMSNTISEGLDRSHRLSQILPSDRTSRKSVAEPVTPKLLVALAEQTGPEAKRDSGDNATAGDVLALLKTLDGDDDLLDPVWLQDAEVHEPCVADRSLGLVTTQLCVDCVANQHQSATARA
jgi:hypothetical protein